MWDELKKRLDSPDSYVSLVLGLAVVLVIGMLIINYFKTKAPQTPTATETENKQEITVQEKLSALPTTHTVKEGETLWSIAQEYYTSGYNWIDISKANNLVNADILFVGQTLTIPKADPIVPTGDISAATTERNTTKKTHTVVVGDSLWKIASAQYSNGFRWADIAQANNLANPNLIHPGNVLSLPE